MLPLLSCLVVGCDQRVVHVFGGYAYDPTQDCLYPPGVVDVIDGPEAGSCPGARCWVAPDGEVYVTDRACDAPPDYQDHTADTSGICVQALAAYGRKGHSRCPAPPDGGP
jgi:hypothetical protein